ncbi:uncharacterized protein LOC131432695 [Malaya genurostris]|uniref:uncharacterized protein LOC131432695 n=1 Tax=Malaya genurostris TaxID=325434 RepID=UPI0026F3DD60|nr:uncharacterized protein LOC131432695 [Malaya genurostris]
MLGSMKRSVFLSVFVLSIVVVLGSSELQQLQNQLNDLGRSFLMTCRTMQRFHATQMVDLNAELIRTLAEASFEIQEIYRITGQFIEEYNMTDPYCIEFVQYMYWTHAKGATEAVQLCAEEVTDKIDSFHQTGFLVLLEQSRRKASEVTTVVVRELAMSSVRKIVKESVGEELDTVKVQYLQMIEDMKQSLTKFSEIRKTGAEYTTVCTKKAVEEYAFHMGYLKYYLNKNKNCRK